MVEMSTLDIDLYTQMIEAGVLTDTKQASTRRAIFVGCPDCDKLKDKCRHHGLKIGQKLHPMGAMHGGAAAFHPKSPLNGPVPFPLEWFCYKIYEAFLVKATESVAWYTHAPCGAAYAAGLNLAQLIELQLTNRGYFINYMQNKYRIPRLEVSPYIHLDLQAIRSEKIRRTFLIDLTAWLEFRDQIRDHLSTLPYQMPLTVSV